MVTNRAALYLTMGEPYLNELWFEMFKRNAIDDIDVLYVAVDPVRDDIPAENRKYFIELFSDHPKVKILYTKEATLKCALHTLYKNCEQKYYVLIQDDCFILKNHALVPYFNDIESGYFDIIGSPMRNYYPQQLHDRLIEQFAGDDKNWEYYPFKHAGYSYWQNMVFGKTQDMLDTGIKFDYGPFGPETKVDYLDEPFDESSGLDIFSPEILMHRAAGKKMGYNDQGYLSRDDMQDYLNMRGIFTGNSPWLHLGTMSNFYGDIVQFVMKEETTDPGVIREYERRVAWYLLLLGWYPEVRKKLPKYAEKIDKYILHLRSVYPFSKYDMPRRLKIYSELLRK